MTGGLFREVLSWAVPPVVGAVIGYVTNDIAIRMLFRPLREVRLFGLRLPFTPGIFPKERYTLSRSIGRMVSAELITEDALRRQVHSDKAQAALARSISSVTANLLGSPLGALSAAGAEKLAEPLEGALHGLLAGLLGSPSVRHDLRRVVERAVAPLASRDLGEAMDSLGLRRFICERLLPSLAGKESTAAAARSVTEALRRAGPGILSDTLLDAVVRALEPLLPRLAARVATWLRSAQMRSELEARGTALLSTILDKLNLVQKFLVSAGQFDRRLSEKMPEIVEEAIASLESLSADPARQRKVLDLLVQAVKRWRDDQASVPGREGGAGQASSPGFAGEAVAQLVESLLGQLSDPRTCREVWGWLEAAILGGAGSTVGAFAARALALREGELPGWLADRAAELLARPGMAGTLSAALSSLVAGYLRDKAAVPLGTVLGIDAGRKTRLDAFLLTKLVEVVDAKLPDILRGIDVEQLVVERIDGLDVREVERLIVQVIATHLKWINAFGAILGFVIGVVQDLLRLLRAW